METWDTSEIRYDGRVVRLRVGEVLLDDGRRAMREVVEHPGGVCIIPYTGEAAVLVRQYRIAVADWVLEAPAGKLEPGDDPEARGRMELEEETGYRAGRVIPAGWTYATVGFCSEKIHCFLALDLEPGPQRLEPEERIEIVEVPIGEVRAGLRAHRFRDGKTVIGLRALLDHLDAS